MLSSLQGPFLYNASRYFIPSTITKIIISVGSLWFSILGIILRTYQNHGVCVRCDAGGATGHLRAGPTAGAASHCLGGLTARGPEPRTERGNLSHQRVFLQVAHDQEETRHIHTYMYIYIHTSFKLHIHVLHHVVHALHIMSYYAQRERERERPTQRRALSEVRKFAPKRRQPGVLHQVRSFAP